MPKHRNIGSPFLPTTLSELKKEIRSIFFPKRMINRYIGIDYANGTDKTVTLISDRIVKIKELSETTGNCFSCEFLRRFVPCGQFECRMRTPRDGDAIYSDTNNPPYLNCEYWKIKAGQEVLTVGGQFAGIKNY